MLIQNDQRNYIRDMIEKANNKLPLQNEQPITSNPANNLSKWFADEHDEPKSTVFDSKHIDEDDDDDNIDPDAYIQQVLAEANRPSHKYDPYKKLSDDRQNRMMFTTQPIIEKIREQSLPQHNDNMSYNYYQRPSTASEARLNSKNTKTIQNPMENSYSEYVQPPSSQKRNIASKLTQLKRRKSQTMQKRASTSHGRSIPSKSYHNNVNDTKNNVIERPVTGVKTNKAKSPVTKNISSKKALSSTEELNTSTASTEEEVFLISENLDECSNPNIALKHAITRFNSKIGKRFNAITTIRRLAIYHKFILVPALKSFIKKLKNEVDSLRSSISKNAIVCCLDLFEHLGSKMDNAASILVPSLLKRAGEANVFLAKEADAAITVMINTCSLNKVITILLTNASSGKKRKY